MKNLKFTLTRRIIFPILFRIDNFLKRTNSVIVLCYHSISSADDVYSISSATFKEQIRHLSNYVDFVSIQSVKYLGKKKNTKKPYVVLTFDDGYQDILKVAPFLKRHRIPAIAFVLADPTQANRKELDHKAALLTKENLRELVRFGFSIGSHSMTHADFHTLSKKELTKEIVWSKGKLEKDLGIRIDYFAYPKGRYSDEIMSTVRKAGYKGAFAVRPGVVINATNEFNIPRTIVDKTYNAQDLQYVSSPLVMTLLAKYFWIRIHAIFAITRLFQKINFNSTVQAVKI